MESISKQLEDAQGEALGVNFIKKDSLDKFKKSLNKCGDNDYFEHALDKAAEEIELISVDITGEPVIEIDFPEDLEKAKLLAEEIDAEVKTDERAWH